MSTNQITTLGDSPALLLTQETLEKLGMNIGDEVSIDVSVENRTLTMRPLVEVERKQKMDALMAELLETFRPRRNQGHGRHFAAEVNSMFRTVRRPRPSYVLWDVSSVAIRRGTPSLAVCTTWRDGRRRVGPFTQLLTAEILGTPAT